MFKHYFKDQPQQQPSDLRIEFLRSQTRDFLVALAKWSRGTHQVLSPDPVPCLESLLIERS